MEEKYLQLNGKPDVLKTYHTLLRKEHLLDKILKEIEDLKRGEVDPKDTLRRSKVGSYCTATTQQLRNYIDKQKIKISKKQKKDLQRISHKSDKILRENIILQTKPPLDVIPFENVPIRHSYSTHGGREQRWGFALHKKPFNEEGHSVTVADMPPRYTQSLHNHTLSENCLILDSKTEGVYYPGGKREKIYSTKKHDMLHFSATTPHTLRNPSRNHTRNITFKQAVGLTDWKPASGLNKVKIIRARLLRGHLTRVNAKQTVKRFTIDDKYYHYTLEIIKLEKGMTYTAMHDYDQYIYVINGRLQVTHEDIRKDCKKNDLIVIDKNTKYSLITSTRCRLYTVRY